MLAFYYLGLFLTGAGIVFSNRRYGKNYKTFFEIFIYALIAGMIACFVFFALSGFHLSFNARTVVYALFYAGMVFISYFTTIPVYKYMSAALVGVLSNALTLVLTSICGFVFFREEVTVIAVLRILLMLLAMAFMYPRNIGGGNRKTDFLKGSILCIIASLGTLGSTILMKFFATDPFVTDSNSLFFLTNVFTVSVSVVILLFLKKGNISQAVCELKSMGPMQYLMVFANTLCSNVQSLLSVLILAAGAVSLYAPLSTALNLLAAYVVSVFAKEKIKLIPLLLALAAVFLGAF